MTISIRRGVFETNSSSTHSITMCMKSDYEEWQKGDLYLNKGGVWSSFSVNKDKLFVTKEDVIEILVNSKYPPNVDLTTLCDSAFADFLAEDDRFKSYSMYDEMEYETFHEEFTTPNGDTVVAFGYYGSDY